MNKELEEAINWLKSNIKYYNEQIEFIKATDCDYYDEEQSLYEKRIKIFKNILNYIDNSISKEVIEEKIEEIRKARDTARDLIETKVVIADNDSLYSGQSIAHDYDINILKELLEQK